MRKWLAGKLLKWAARLDWDATINGAALILLSNNLFVKFSSEDEKLPLHCWGDASPRPKRGRPLGSKDGVARKVSVAPKKKIGRPLGSKNKPKVQP